MYTNTVISMGIFETINNTIDLITNYLVTLGPLMGCFLVFLESIIPILPLFVFVTLNFLAFGSICGFFISWICTIFGCLLSYFWFKNKIQNFFFKKWGHHQKIIYFKEKIEKLSLEHLSLIIALPCTPAFLVNIAAGLANMEFKKFLCGLLIGKAAMIYFYGFVGSSLIKSLTNPTCLIKVGISLILCFLISKIVTKKLNFSCK